MDLFIFSLLILRATLIQEPKDNYDQVINIRVSPSKRCKRQMTKDIALRRLLDRRMWVGIGVAGLRRDHVCGYSWKNILAIPQWRG
jgi:hypothetical protein